MPPALVRAVLETLPTIIRVQGERASRRFIEFFTATIRNCNTRLAYGIAPALIATVLVALLVHHFSRIIPGAGIAVPTFIPGFAAAILAILLSREHRPVVAYVAGTIGCLVGADVLNLALVTRLNAPIASIGGAGTFDGVFVSGVIAVLLA